MREYLTRRLVGAHLLVLLALTAAGGLGLWQLGVWRDHRDAEAIDLTHRSPVALRDVLGPNDPFPGDRVGQPVRLRGSWLSGSSVFVSGREHDGRSGYWVVTPLALDDGAAVPVVRGWVAHPASAPAAPSGTAALVGWLQPSDGGGPADDDPSDDVYPELRVADLAQRVDRDLYGAYAVAAPSLGPATNLGDAGLEPAELVQLPDVGAFTSVRNLLYAVEWWFFGGFALFVWWRFVTEETAVGRVEDAEEPASTVGA